MATEALKRKKVKKKSARLQVAGLTSTSGKKRYLKCLKNRMQAQKSAC